MEKRTDGVLFSVGIIFIADALVSLQLATAAVEKVVLAIFEGAAVSANVWLMSCDRVLSC